MTFPIRRFIRMPGVREVEDFCKFGLNPNSEDTRSLIDRCDALTISLFGITRHSTLFNTPPEYDDGSMPIEDRWDVEAEKTDYEEQFVTEAMGFDEAKVEHLLLLGWDLNGDNGQPLLITRYVCRVIEAVAKGIAGTAPEADVVDTKNWAEQMQRQADQFKRKKRDRSGAK